jgi:hypothetical protein
VNTRTRRILGLIAAFPLVLLVLALAHYQVWLRSFAGSTVRIEPGKWVWVECQMQSFEARIESIGLEGVTLESEAEVAGIPCSAVGIAGLGGGRYFFPFQTVLSVEAVGRVRWKNPFPG